MTSMNMRNIRAKGIKSRFEIYCKEHDVRYLESGHCPKCQFLKIRNDFKRAKKNRPKSYTVFERYRSSSLQGSNKTN